MVNRFFKRPEEVLFGDAEPLVGIPTAIKVPPEMLAKARCSRQAVLKLCKGYKDMTFSLMKSLLKPELEHIEGMDRHFKLDLVILQEHAQAHADDVIRQQVLAAMPSGAHMPKKTMKDIALAVLKLKESAMAKASGEAMQDELTDIVSLIHSVAGEKNHTPPTHH